MSSLLDKIKKFFHFIFFGEGLASDLAFIAFVALIVLLLRSIFPLISVVMSSSMQHDNFNYEKYAKLNIAPEKIQSWPFPNGINKGDMVIILPTNPYSIKPGTVILYNSRLFNKPILHRVVKVVNESEEVYYIVMGDNNPGPTPEEWHITPDQIIGKVVLRIPYLGYPKVILCDLTHFPAFC